MARNEESIMLKKKRGTEKFRLLPPPKMMTAKRGALALTQRLTLSYSRKEIKNEAQALAEMLGTKAVRLRRDAGYWLILSAGDDLPETEEKPVGEEGYLLEITPSALTLTANSERGIFYGIQTLRQVAEQSPGRKLPALSIKDWPDMRMRGAHISYFLVSEKRANNVPDFPGLLRAIERFAQYKINTLFIAFDAMFPYRKHKDLSCKIAFTPAQIRKLAAFAKAHHIEIIPQVHCLGHAEWILQHPQYAHLREDPKNNRNFCLLNPGTKQLYFELVEEVKDLLPDLKHLHMGGDEVGIGRCPKCSAKMKKKGAFPFLLDYYAQIARGLHARGMTPIVWTDYLAKSGEEIERLPKYLKLLDWSHIFPDSKLGRSAYPLNFFLRHGFPLISTAYVRAGARNRFLEGYDMKPWLKHVRDLKANPRHDQVEGVVACTFPHQSPFALTWYGFIATAAATWARMDKNTLDEHFVNLHFGMCDICEMSDIGGISDTEVIRALSLVREISIPYAQTIYAHCMPDNRADFSGTSFPRSVAVYTDEVNRKKWLPRVRKHEKTLATVLQIIDRALNKASKNRKELLIFQWAVEGLLFTAHRVWLIDRMVQLTRKRSRITESALREIKQDIAALKKESRELRRRAQTLFYPETFQECVDRNNEFCFGQEQDEYLDNCYRRLRKLMGQHDRYVSNVVSAREADVYYLETYGASKERGIQHGKAFAPRIRGFITAKNEYFVTMRKKRVALAKTKNYLRGNAPHILEELEGLAQGARVSLDDMIIYQSGWVESFASSGCTVIAFSGNKIFLGKNNDSCPGELASAYQSRNLEAGVLVQRMTQNSKTVLSVGLVGTLWSTVGINSQGLAVSGASAPGPKKPPMTGMFPPIAIHSLLLECDSVEEAIRRLKQIPWVGSRACNLALADASGQIARASKMGDLLDIEKKEVGWVYATNHYQSQRMIKNSSQPPFSETSLWSLCTVNRIKNLEEMVGNFGLCRLPWCDIKDIQRVLGFHSPMPYAGNIGSLCGHGRAEHITEWSAIADIEKRTLYFSGTYPCEKNYKIFEM